MTGMDNMNNKILVAGDWHGRTAHAEMAMRLAQKFGYKIIVHTGDFGALWPAGGNGESKFTRLIVKWAESRGLVIIWADGNHDNHKAARALPVNHDGFGVLSGRVLYAPRGQRWTLGGRRFGALGGAMSIDRAGRTEGKSWWPEEVVLQSDVERLGHEPLDVLITHEVPAGIKVSSQLIDPLPQEIAWSAWQQRLLVEQAVRNSKPDLVFSGHWHQRVVQQLPHSDTVVHVLDRDGHQGNMVELDLVTMKVTEFETKPL